MILKSFKVFVKISFIGTRRITSRNAQDRKSRTCYNFERDSKAQLWFRVNKDQMQCSEW